MCIVNPSFVLYVDLEPISLVSNILGSFNRKPNPKKRGKISASLVFTWDREMKIIDFEGEWANIMRRMG